METLSFDITVLSRLISPRECAPIIHAYLTSDIGTPPTVVVTDDYQTRIVTGRSRKTLGPPPSALADDPLPYIADKIVFTAALPARFDAKIPRDASLCIQVYCEIACEEDWGLHTCGWACVPLIEISNSRSAQIELPLCDQGRSDTGARGTVIVSVVNQSHTMQLLKSAKFSHGPSLQLRRGSLYGAQARYESEITAILKRDILTSGHIRTRRPPSYASCGGCVVRPACAFLLARDIPRISEDYYVSALATVIERRFRGAPLVDRQKAGEAFIGGVFGGNEAGAVLMDVAMLLSTSCTYLFDEVLSPDGSCLISGEDFSRCLNVMLTADCEDFSFHAVMTLWDILEAKSSGSGEWTSPGVRALQRIRSQYIATVVLKAVRGPQWNAFDSSIEANCKYSAHDCCDIIPVLAFSRMIRAGGGDSTPIDDIAKERSTVLSSNNSHLMAIIGEGTGRIVECSRGGGIDPSTAPRRFREHALDIFSNTPVNVGSPMSEDHNSSTSFYQYAMFGIVHDTLISARRTGSNEWPVAQVKYVHLTDRSGQTLGAPHDAYTRCDTSEIAAVPLPSPPPDVMDAMYALEKFEHPSIPLAVHDTSIPLVTDRLRAVESMVERVRSAIPAPRKRILTEVDAPLWELSDPTLATLETSLRKDGCWVEVVFEKISKAVIVASFLISFDS